VSGELFERPGARCSASAGAALLFADGAATSYAGEADFSPLLRTKLAPYKIPEKILFAAELSRNATGKVQKNLIRGELENLVMQPA
jgi:malonyl-CoA/methylmalonyl-CoA synthetase